MADCWETVRQAVLDNQSWLTIANRLRKHLERKYPNLIHSKQIPVTGTIRTRVKRLYQKELTRRGVL